MATKAMVKCYYCGEYFDRNAEAFVPVSSRRYAHKKCYDKINAEKTQDEKDYEKLCNYIKQKFLIKTITIKISKQIADYKKEYNFTYSGMLKALIW